MILAASLIGSALLLKWSLNQLDPNAGAKKAAKHKKKEIARRLGLDPGSIETNQYEDIIALEVVTHNHLDVQGLRDVGGLEEIKEALHNKVIAPLREPMLFQSSLLRQAKGVLLYGPPGTGKTMLAKALAAESGACFVIVKPSTLQSKWFGETNKLVTAVFTLGKKFFSFFAPLSFPSSFLCIRCGLPKTDESAPRGRRRGGKKKKKKKEENSHSFSLFHIIQKRKKTPPANKLQPSIIFIDEVDALLGKRRDQEHEAVTAMKTEFMQLWDGFSTDPTSNVMVLAATNRPFDLDEAVLRRFSAQFEVPLPDERQREAILKLTLAKHVEEAGEATVERLLRTNAPAPSAKGGGGSAKRRPLAEIAAATRGFSGSDLHELCAAAAVIPVHEFMSSLRVAVGFEDAVEEVADGNESSNGNNNSSSRSNGGSNGSNDTRSRRTASSRRARSPPRGRRPRQLSAADFHTALRSMRPSGDHAAAYRASVGSDGNGGVLGGSMDVAMAALMAALGGGAGRPAGAAA